MEVIRLEKEIIKKEIIFTIIMSNLEVENLKTEISCLTFPNNWPVLGKLLRDLEDPS